MGNVKRTIINMYYVQWDLYLNPPFKNILISLGSSNFLFDFELCVFFIHPVPTTWVHSVWRWKKTQLNFVLSIFNFIPQPSNDGPACIRTKDTTWLERSFVHL